MIKQCRVHGCTAFARKHINRFDNSTMGKPPEWMVLIYWLCDYHWEYRANGTPVNEYIEDVHGNMTPFIR